MVAVYVNAVKGYFPPCCCLFAMRIYVELTLHSSDCLSMCLASAVLLLYDILCAYFTCKMLYNSLSSTFHEPNYKACLWLTKFVE